MLFQIRRTKIMYGLTTIKEINKRRTRIYGLAALTLLPVMPATAQTPGLGASKDPSE